MGERKLEKELDSGFLPLRSFVVPIGLLQDDRGRMLDFYKGVS
jgi:hypothetical protein